MAENCVRVPREEAEKMGWVARAGNKLRKAKDKLLSATSGNKLNTAQDATDLKDLYDYRDLLGAIDNKRGTLQRNLNGWFPKLAEKATQDIRKFYLSQRDLADENGLKTGRSPIGWTDELNMATHLAKQNARIAFRDSAIKNGVIGRTKNNPNFQEISKNNKYNELRVKGNKSEQYGVLPHLRKQHEDVFSALARDEQRARSNSSLSAPRKQGESMMDYGLRKGWYALKNSPAMSTAAIMWSPFFHMVNIGGRWIVPMVLRNPKSWARTGRYIKQAWQDMNDPERVEQLGKKGFTQLSPHAWQEHGAPQIRDLFYKIPGFQKTFGWLLNGIDKSMPGFINYAGHLYYHMALDDMLRKGTDPRAAEVLAAHRATTLMGTLPKTLLGKNYRQFADTFMFSTRYTTTSLQLFSRALAKDEHLRTKLTQMGIKPEAIEKALGVHRAEFQKLLVKDYVAMLTFANIINYVATSHYNMADKNGKKGGHFIWDNPGSNWYKDFVNVKATYGVDEKSGKPLMMGTPMRSTRDVAELLTGWYAIASGADTGESIFEPYMNKSNQFWQLFADAVKGTNWAGKTLNMPTTPETMASWAGDAAERLTPFEMRGALVTAITRMEGGDAPVWHDMVNAMSDADVKQLVTQGLVRTFGGQTSMGEKYGEPKAETYAAQEKVMSWLSTPEIRTALAKGDSRITQIALDHLRDAGIVGINAQKKLEYAIKQGAGTTPTSKSVRVYESEQEQK